MKKIGEYTARGKVKTAFQERIQLFDGRFDTAYRVVKFRVWGSDWDSSTTANVIGRICTESNTVSSTVNFMDASDNTQIGWSFSDSPSGTWGVGSGNILDRDNLIVEDLFLMCISANDTDDINYLIEMEKYDITDWQGALTMSRNKSQA